MKKLFTTLSVFALSALFVSNTNAQQVDPVSSQKATQLNEMGVEKKDRTRRDYTATSLDRSGNTSKWFNYAFSSAQFVSGSTTPVVFPIHYDSSLIVNFQSGPGHWNLHAFSNTFDPASSVFSNSIYNGDVQLFPNTTYSVDSLSIAGFYARGSNWPAFTLDTLGTSISDSTLVSTSLDTVSTVFDSTFVDVYDTTVVVIDSTLLSTTYDTLSVVYDTISNPPLVVDTIYDIDTLFTYDYITDTLVDTIQTLVNVDTTYVVDTVNVYDYTFVYNIDTIATVDTLIVEVARVPANGSIFFFTDAATDGFRAVNYSGPSNSLNIGQKQIVKIPLDDAFYADSTLEGFHITDIALPSPITVAGGNNDNPETAAQRQVLVTAVSFKPGYTPTFGAELFGQSFYYVPLIREIDGAEPFYEPYVWNMTYVANSTVRYEQSPGATGWNGLYLPRLAFNPGALNEGNMEVEYKVTALTNFDFVSTEVEKASGIKVSQNMPNPARDITFVDYELPTSANIAFRVFDITGKEVYSANEGLRGEGTHRFQLNTSNFSAGMYYYSIQVNGEVAATKKMIIVE